MKCYPIIYTRTNCCDYYANFHVIPEFVNANEVRPYILSATVGLDPTSKRIKKLIFANNQYCVFGYVGFIKDIFENMGSSIQQYTRDNKGRAVYGFFGFVVQDTGFGTIPLLKDEDCLAAFEQYIMPSWRNTVPESVVPSPVILGDAPYTSVEVQPICRYEDCCIYNEESNLFDVVLTNWFTAKSAVSYCSWIEDFAQIRNCLFTHVVTTDNNIFRLNAENNLAQSVPSAEVGEINSPTERHVPLSAAEELQMMMRNEKELQNHISELTDDAKESSDTQSNHEIQSQNCTDYQHLYQSSEMSARVQVQASKKKDVAAEDTRIPQEPVFDQININSSEHTELVKKGVIVAVAVVAAVGVSAAVNIAVKKRREKRKQKNERKEGKKNGK